MDVGVGCGGIANLIQVNTINGWCVSNKTLALAGSIACPRRCRPWSMTRQWGLEAGRLYCLATVVVLWRQRYEQGLHS